TKLAAIYRKRARTSGKTTDIRIKRVLDDRIALRTTGQKQLRSPNGLLHMVSKDGVDHQRSSTVLHWRGAPEPPIRRGPAIQCVTIPMADPDNLMVSIRCVNDDVEVL